ncbi:hypothetical protein ACFPRL_22330 [Pseudoclavibacter helvolus]
MRSRRTSLRCPRSRAHPLPGEKRETAGTLLRGAGRFCAQWMPVSDVPC